MRKVIFFFFIGLFLVGLTILTNIIPAYLSTDMQNNTENPTNKKQFYGCGIVFEAIHCEPLRNIVLNNFDGIARTIHDPSKLIKDETTSYGSVSVEPRVRSLPNVPNGEWQFIAVTWDGTMLKLYRNGILEGIQPRIGSLVKPVLAQIGSGEQEGISYNYWKGEIDEIRVYKKALTENEIVEIFTASEHVLDEIIGYWTLDGNTNDISGNNNHGTYSGDKPEFIDGVVGKALQFDGNDRIDLPSKVVFSNALSFTAWVKLNIGTDDGSRTIFNNNQFFLRVDPQSEVSNRFAAFLKIARDKTSIYRYSYEGLIASMAFAPDGRLFFTEKNTGKIMIMNDDKVLDIPFAIIPNIFTPLESGLLGLTLDPNFDENHFVYVYYTYTDDKTGQPFNRIIRFTDDDNRGTDMKILLDRIPANRAGIHNGGALAFGPDGKLYVTVGDNLKPESSQNPSVITGKILRINGDGTIPDDNPWFWDGNPSRTYTNEVLDENLICEFGQDLRVYDLKYCNFSIQNSENNRFIVEKDFMVKQTNHTSIKFTVNNPSSDVSFYRDYRKSQGAFILENERDWSQYTYLTLWLNGSNDNSVLGLKLRDSNWDDHGEEYLITNNFTGWKSFVIPLKDVYPTMNFSSIRGIEFLFHKGWGTTINLDAVYLTNSSDPLAERKQYSSVSPVYTIGHRNMFGIAFDSEGRGIVTENGLDNFDEINRIQRGGNYGWPTYQPPDIAPELSEFSIKPLTSYSHIIAPAQAIYYNGDQIPELKGKFLFAAYITGNLYALHFDENNEEIVYEEVVNANHTGPAISLAQSPDGSIYYGGTGIYELEKVNLRKKEQLLFSVEITGQVEVRNLQLFKDEKKMVIEMTALETPSYVAVKIPSILLDGILSVSDEGQPVDFRLDDSSGYYNIISVHLAKNHSELTIAGSTVIPEFSTPVNIFMIALISFIVAVFLVTRSCKKTQGISLPKR